MFGSMLELQESQTSVLALYCGMQFSASALSLYLHSSLLPELELQDQGHILGIVAALYSELPPALMTKVLFSVKFHML